jgi:hypothetical protein
MSACKLATDAGFIQCRDRRVRSGLRLGKHHSPVRLLHRGRKLQEACVLALSSCHHSSSLGERGKIKASDTRAVTLTPAFKLGHLLHELAERLGLHTEITDEPVSVPTRFLRRLVVLRLFRGRKRTPNERHLEASNDLVGQSFAICNGVTHALEVRIEEWLNTLIVSSVRRG